jgi:hypothetical protein
MAAGQSIWVKVAGFAGVPATGASAVVLNITAVAASANSYLSVYPDGVSAPNSSSVNFGPGANVPNLVTTRLGDDGWAVIYNSAGSVDVIADVQGWFDSGDDSGSSSYTPLSPSRVLDTRNGTGAVAGRLGSDASLDLLVAGRGGVPATNVSAVAMNVTVAGPTASSYLTVWPTGVARPNASNLNYQAGVVVPNMVIVPVGSGGMVSLYNAVGTTDVVADVVGWFGTAATSQFTPLTPTRVLDTRNGTGAIGPGATRVLDLDGHGGVPPGATGVVLNVTVTNPTAGSYLALWPSDVARPNASNLNFGPAVTIANMVSVKLSPAGTVSIYNQLGSVDVLADVVAYLT